MARGRGQSSCSNWARANPRRAEVRCQGGAVEAIDAAPVVLRSLSPLSAILSLDAKIFSADDRIRPRSPPVSVKELPGGAPQRRNKTMKTTLKVSSILGGLALLAPAAMALTCGPNTTTYVVTATDGRHGTGIRCMTG